MSVKIRAVGMMFKAVAALSAIGVVSAMATTAYGAFAESKDRPGYAVELAAKIKQAIDDIGFQQNEDGTPKYNLSAEASVADYQAAILAAVSQATLNHSSDDPELVSAALGMVAAQFDVLTVGSTRVAPNFVVAFRAVQQQKLEEAILDTVQDAIQSGGLAASEDAIAADIAKTITMANVPAASAQAAFSSASSQLARSSIASPAVTTAVTSVQSAIQTAIQTATATGNNIALQSTFSIGGTQGNNALSGSVVNQSNNSGGLGGDSNSNGQTTTTVYVG